MKELNTDLCRWKEKLWSRGPPLPLTRGGVWTWQFTIVIVWFTHSTGAMYPETLVTVQLCWTSTLTECYLFCLSVHLIGGFNQPSHCLTSVLVRGVGLIRRSQLSVSSTLGAEQSRTVLRTSNPWPATIFGTSSQSILKAFTAQTGQKHHVE